MTKRERYLAFGVGACVGLWALMELVVDPVLNAMDAASERLVQAEGAYIETQGLVDGRFRVERKWRGYQRAGLNESIATARLLTQQMVTRWAADAGVELATLSAGGVLEDEGFKQVRLTASLNGELEDALAFLKSLEACDLPLAVLSCDISRRDTSKSQVTLRLILSTVVLSTPDKEAV